MGPPLPVDGCHTSLEEQAEVGVQRARNAKSDRQSLDALPDRTRLEGPSGGKGAAGRERSWTAARPLCPCDCGGRPPAALRGAAHAAVMLTLLSLEARELQLRLRPPPATSASKRCSPARAARRPAEAGRASNPAPIRATVTSAPRTAPLHASRKIFARSADDTSGPPQCSNWPSLASCCS